MWSVVVSQPSTPGRARPDPLEPLDCAGAGTVVVFEPLQVRDELRDLRVGQVERGHLVARLDALRVAEPLARGAPACSGSSAPRATCASRRASGRARRGSSRGVPRIAWHCAHCDWKSAPTPRRRRPRLAREPRVGTAPAGRRRRRSPCARAAARRTRRTGRDSGRPCRRRASTRFVWSGIMSIFRFSSRHPEAVDDVVGVDEHLHRRPHGDVDLVRRDGARAGIPHLPPELVADDADRQLRLLRRRRDWPSGRSCRGSGRCPRRGRAPTARRPARRGRARARRRAPRGRRRARRGTPGGSCAHPGERRGSARRSPNAERRADEHVPPERVDAAGRLAVRGERVLLRAAAGEQQHETTAAGSACRAAASRRHPRAQFQQRLPSPSALKRGHRKGTRRAPVRRRPARRRRLCARRRAPPPARPPSRGRRVASFAAGVAVLLIALLSPLDRIGEERLFSVHMTQHLLIGDVAPLLSCSGSTARCCARARAAPSSGSACSRTRSSRSRSGR